jgi:hypothetical protein
MIRTVFILLISSAIVNSLKPLRRAPRDVRVGGNFFVHLRGNATEEEKQDLARILESRNANASDLFFNAKIKDWPTEVMNGFIGRLSYKALDFVRRSEIVEFVEEDQVVYGSGEVLDFSHEPPNDFWGLDRLDQESLPLDNRFHRPCGNLTGRGVNVYVMDTGIMYNHMEFYPDRAEYPGCDPIMKMETMPGSNMGEDCHGHGTHVAGIAGGNKISASPGVKLFSVRVLRCNNIGTVEALLEGFDCIVKHHKRGGKRPSIINFSINAIKTETLTKVIRRVVRKGINIVTVAGNHRNGPEDSCTLSSGDVTNSIMVSASDKSDHAWSGSNLGRCIDVFVLAWCINQQCTVLSTELFQLWLRQPIRYIHPWLHHVWYRQWH